MELPVSSLLLKERRKRTLVKLMVAGLIIMVDILRAILILVPSLQGLSGPTSIN